MRRARSTNWCALRARHPQALLLAGSTDVGLWVTKQMRDLGDIIYLGHVDELKTVTEARRHDRDRRRRHAGTTPTRRCAATIRTN